MSTLTALPTSVESYLHRFVRRQRSFALLHAAGLALSFTMIWTLLCCLLDRVWQLPSPMRLVLLILHGGAVAAILYRPLRAKFSRNIDWISAAEEVERRSKRFGEGLQTIASQLLSPPRHRASDAILTYVAAEVSAQAADDDPAALLSWKEIDRPWLIALASLAIMAALFFSTWLDLPRLMTRYYAPLSNAFPATTTRINVLSGSFDVMRGAPAEITAEVENLDGNIVKLHTSHDGEEWITTAMAPAGPERFIAKISSIEKDVRYRVSGGDATTDTYLIRALKPPTITSIRARYAFPDYMNEPPREVVTINGAVEAPVGTTLRIIAHASEPLESAELVAGANAIAMTSSSEPATYESDIKVSRDVTYIFRLLSESGASGTGPDIRVRAIPDRAPMIRLIYPSADLRLRPRDILTLQYLAMDDFGLSELAAEIQINSGEATTLPITLRGDGLRQESVFEFDLAALPLAIGDLVAVKLTASDRAGQEGESEARNILISPQSVEMNTHLRIAELKDAAESIEAMAGHWSAAHAAAERAIQSSLNSRERAAALTEVDMEITMAGESAAMALRALLRTIIHSEDQRLADALANFADVVQMQKDWAERLRQMAGDDGAEVTQIRSLHEQTNTLLSNVRTILQGERAAALLAEHENLLASDVRRETRPESQENRAAALGRAREDIAAAAREAGLDPGSGDLVDRLRLAAEIRGRLLAGQQPLSFAEASRQWAIDRSKSKLPIAGRLETAAQAEAIRPDSDMNRAHDLELASRAARALDERAPSSLDYPDALAALEAEHRLRRERHINREENEVRRMHESAAEARRKMKQWADDFKSIAPEDRQLAMQANAEMANRNYEAAAALDQKRIQPATTQTTRANVELPAAKLAMQQAQRVDTLLAEQEQIRKETRRAISENAEDATALSERQEELAKAIDETGKKSAASSEMDTNTRRAAIEAIGQAQIALAGTPHQLSAASEAARHRRDAANRAQAAAQALESAPADQQQVARRIADEAQRQLHEAQQSLNEIAAPVQQRAIEELLFTLSRFTPDSSAAEKSIRENLMPAIVSLRDAFNGDDAARVDSAAADVRRAIEQVQNKLRQAQDDLMDQDPLASANWFARAAAAALGKKPADLAAAEAHQQKVSAALGKAWNDAAQRAAAGRLSATSSMAWLYRLGIELQGVPGMNASTRALPDVPALRQWGQLPQREADELNLSLRESDPRGYEDSIKLYFEALGQSEQKK